MGPIYLFQVETKILLKCEVVVVDLLTAISLFKQGHFSRKSSYFGVLNHRLNSEVCDLFIVVVLLSQLANDLLLIKGLPLIYVTAYHLLVSSEYLS